MENWVEVAPAAVLSPPRRISSSPRLETIFEEGYFGNYAPENGEMELELEREVDSSNRAAVYFLPVIVAMATYYLLINAAAANRSSRN